MIGKAGPARKSQPWLLAVLAFSLGFLVAFPVSQTVNSSCPVLATSRAACHCPRHSKQEDEDTTDEYLTVAAADSGSLTPTSQQYFCPWDSGLSAFLNASTAVNFGHNQSACVDTILYGYDLIFEKRLLFAHMKWLGVAMQQDPMDSHILQEMLWKVKPDVVIELGTSSGGGALYFASIMSLISGPGGAGRVITIDPRDHQNAWMGNENCSDDDPCLSALDNPLWKERVTFIQGNPTDAPVLNKVRALLKEWGAERVMVSEDSSHTYTAVWANLLAYAQFVTPGSYLLVQDTKLTRFQKSKECAELSGEDQRQACLGRHNPRVGPGDAAADFVDHMQGAFVADRSLEYLFYTQHAGGFLKRVG